jgi:hypothetical protein
MSSEVTRCVLREATTTLGRAYVANLVDRVRRT